MKKNSELMRVTNSNNRRKSSVSSSVVLIMTKERRNIFSYIRVQKLYIIARILGNFEPLLLLNKETF